MINRILAAFALAIALAAATGSPAYATEESAPASAPASAEAPASAPASADASEPAEQPNKPPACAAYTYYGTETSLCDDHPGDADRTCSDVGYRVQLKDSSVDPWDLDGLSGGDRGVVGIGCESFPRKPVKPTVSPTAAPTTDSTAVPPPAGPSLPVTGPSGWLLGGIGAALMLGGLAAYAAVRRRQTRFEA